MPDPTPEAPWRSHEKGNGGDTPSPCPDGEPSATAQATSLGAGAALPAPGRRSGLSLSGCLAAPCTVRTIDLVLELTKSNLEVYVSSSLSGCARPGWVWFVRAGWPPCLTPTEIGVGHEVLRLPPGGAQRHRRHRRLLALRLGHLREPRPRTSGTRHPPDRYGLFARPCPGTQGGVPHLRHGRDGAVTPQGALATPHSPVAECALSVRARTLGLPGRRPGSPARRPGRLQPRGG